MIRQVADRLRHTLPAAFAVAGATCMVATIAYSFGDNPIARAAGMRGAVGVTQIGSLIAGMLMSIVMTRPKTVEKASRPRKTETA